MLLICYGGNKKSARKLQSVINNRDSEPEMLDQETRTVDSVF